MAEFTKLTPGKLDKSAIVPQALDPYWIPRKTLSKWKKNEKNIQDIRRFISKEIKQEWRRSLLYGRQVVLDRELFFEAPVYKDYNEEQNRKDFQRLLNQSVIVPFLRQVRSPTEKSERRYPLNAWQAWQEVVAETKMSCVRLSWEDQREDIQKFDRNFHQYIQTLNGEEQARHLMGTFDIPEKDQPAFRKTLIKVARYAFDTASQGEYVNRDDLYRAFILAEDTEEDQYYFADKPFAADLKQIFDLKYHVNLPDALGRYALTPYDSPPRTTLGDLQREIRAPITEDNLGVLIYALKRLAFGQVAEGMYLKGLHYLTLGDVLDVRSKPEWSIFVQSLDDLLANPLNFSEGGAEIAKNFGPLNRIISEKVVKEKTAFLQPVVKFVLFVGGKALEVYLDQDNPNIKLFSASTGHLASGAAPLVMRLVVSGLSKINRNVGMSIDFMRGTVANGSETWEEIIGQLSNQPGFNKIEEKLRFEEVGIDANQSQPEQTTEY